MRTLLFWIRVLVYPVLITAVKPFISNPSMVTPSAVIENAVPIPPSTLLSEVRIALHPFTPLLAPLIVSALLIVTFSVYVPADAVISSPGEAESTAD